MSNKENVKKNNKKNKHDGPEEKVTKPLGEKEQKSGANETVAKHEEAVKIRELEGAIKYQQNQSAEYQKLLQIKIKQLQQEKSEANDRIQQNETNAKDLEQKLEDSESVILKLQSEMERMEGAVRELREEKEVESGKYEEGLQATVGQIQDELLKKDETVGQLKNELRDAVTCYQNYKVQLEELELVKEQHAELETKLEDLVKEQLETTRSNEQFKMRISALEDGEALAAKRDEENLVKIRDLEVKHLEVVEQHKDSMEKAKKHHSLANEENKNKIKALEKRHAVVDEEHKTKIKDLETEVTKAAGGREEAKQEADRMKVEIASTEDDKVVLTKINLEKMIRIEELERKGTEADKREEETRIRIRNLEKKVTDASKVKSELKAEVDKMRKAEAKSCEEYETKLKDVKSELVKARISQGDLEQEKLEAVGANELLKSQVTDLEEVQLKSSDNVDQLISKVKDQEEKLEKATSSNLQYQAEIEELKKMNVKMEEVAAGQRAKMEEMARKYDIKIKEIEMEYAEKMNAVKEAMDVDSVQMNDKNRALKEELENVSKCTEATIREVQSELMKRDETIDELVKDNHEKEIKIEKLAAEEREAIEANQISEGKMKDIKGELSKARRELEVKAEELKNVKATAAKTVNQYQSTIEDLEKKRTEDSNQYKIMIDESVDKYESKLDEFERMKLEDSNTIKDCLEKIKDLDEKRKETLQKNNRYKSKIEETTKQFSTKIEELEEQKVEVSRSIEQYQARIQSLEQVQAESTLKAVALVAGAALIAVVAWKR